MMLSPSGAIPPSVPILLPDTPPGLEFLQATHAIMIQQCVEIFEVGLGFDTNNRYHIMDGYGRRIYYAAENSSCCARCCCGNSRAWEIHVFTGLGQPCMVGNRSCGYATICGNSCICRTSNGVPLGGVEQICGCCSIQWNINDESGTPVLRLKSPCCSVWCTKLATCCEAEFGLFSMGGEKVGSIKKLFGGYLKEKFTNADTFTCEFPIDLDVRLKAVLIYATFLIDFMFYEDKGTSGKGGHGGAALAMGVSGSTLV